MTNHLFIENRPFSDYLNDCKTLIESNRSDLKTHPDLAFNIITANMPFELLPKKPILENKHPKYGVLLVHGLLDCPFTLRDIAEKLQASGMLVRTLLLPGHGTQPRDLVTISFSDWLKSVKYGINSFKDAVEKIYLIGYSTGGALSIYHALHQEPIAGIILLAPAIKIKNPVDAIIALQQKFKIPTHLLNWIYKDEEIDYSRYRSISFNAVKQVAKLTMLNQKMYEKQDLPCPMLVIITQEDETVSHSATVKFFMKNKHRKSKLIMFTTKNNQHSDARTIVRNAHFPKLKIKNLSHIGLPISPRNQHYGTEGDFQFASHPNTPSVIYGAYNPLEVRFFDWLKDWKLLKKTRKTLTYNPDFDFMAEQIVEFILTTS